ncbi:succinylglutamate desuccinylase [termite gut metagenome]|uniref:Succinylglutamate desuccinylase n=1 Tax=termite gut metagenome TaxID=433724 RepID=A0A5J4QBL4_9ZZZZ
MIKTIVSEELPVGEKFEIRKNIIKGKSSDKRICIVTGTHGDELEGQYICFELARQLNENLEYLHGNVEIYPALNPLGVDSITRGFPAFDLDMNRIFPGAINGHLIENTAYKIIQDLKGADMVLDIHSSNIYLREVMQVRINIQTTDELTPYAKMLNTDFIWVYDAVTVLQSTLAHTLNSVGTKTLVVEMGIGMRITREYGNRLVEGIFNMMSEMGMWKGEKSEAVSVPLLSTEGEVVFMNAEVSGVIIPEVSHSAMVKKGDRLCRIVEPFEGKVLQDVLSPVDGFVFTMRTYPIVYEGSLIARIYKPNHSLSD